MFGAATTTVAFQFKSAFFAMAANLWTESHPEMLVSWNTIGANVPDEHFLVLGVEGEQEKGPLSSSNRTREETLRLETQMFITRWGEVDAAKEAEEYLYARLGDLEYQLRKVDPTLGGVVRECFLVSHAVVPESFNRNNTQGHIAGAIAIWEAKARITG